MNFRPFREFRRIASKSIEAVAEYLANDLANVLRELDKGLTRLEFDDNFNSFRVEVTNLAAGAELQIRNQLREDARPVIPKDRLIVRGKSGSEDIVDGDTDWTENFVYLKNAGSSTASFTVIFFK